MAFVARSWSDHNKWLMANALSKNQCFKSGYGSIFGIKNGLIVFPQQPGLFLGHHFPLLPVSAIHPCFPPSRRPPLPNRIDARTHFWFSPPVLLNSAATQMP